MLARAAWFSGLLGIIVVNWSKAVVICSTRALRSEETPSERLESASVWAVGGDRLIVFGVSSDSSELSAFFDLIVDWENNDAASPSITLVGGPEEGLLGLFVKPDAAANFIMNC
jgi:hypothetical protein